MISVVLIQPEIPPNTGNIGRLCCAVGATLHLVRPLGFQLDDRSLKRAGLDYWHNLDLVVWDDLQSYLNSTPTEHLVLTSSKRGMPYHKIEFRRDDHVLFGSETTGLPAKLLDLYRSRIACIPVKLDKVRSLNLATSAGIVIYEALKQTEQLPGQF